mgnify:CR=1 FL=1
MEKSLSFELGPIRPPSESQSILLRLTRNCPWNKCAFCPVYKGEKFSPRTVEEVISDIDAIAALRDIIQEKIRALGLDDKDPRSAIHGVKHLVREIDADEGYIRQVAFWMYYGMKSLFLQDADSLAMKTERVVAILRHAREKFPGLKRITSYSRARTVSRKSLEEMVALREAGLNRIHIGMESGSDRVLELVCKGVTQEEQIDAGKKAIAAGFELSEYYMPGVGGMEFLEENAAESAKVINAVNPTFIRIRSVIPSPGTPLFTLYREKKWTYPGDEDKVRELRLFIEQLHGITSAVKSDHIMNPLEDIEGNLPGDKEAMLSRIDAFFAMDPGDRESFIIGRRMGRFRGIDDYRRSEEIERIKRQIKGTYQSFDEGILEILWNYI